MEGKKYEWLKSFFELFAACFIGGSVLWLCYIYLPSRNSKQPIITDSGRNGSLDERYRATGELLAAVGTRLSVVEAGLGSVTEKLSGNVSGFYELTERIRSIVPEVRAMEEELFYIRRSISEFNDHYYSTLDAEIEKELGIRIPK